MLFKSLTFVLLLFLLGCSTPPVKYKQPTKSGDYKNYITLKDQKEKRSVGQKIKDVFVKPKPSKSQEKTNTVTTKKLLPLSRKKERAHTIPVRRVRPLNTNVLDNSRQISLAVEPVVSINRESDNTLMKKFVTYFIYFQSFIIIILVFLIVKNQKKKKKIPAKKRELNL